MKFKLSISVAVLSIWLLSSCVVSAEQQGSIGESFKTNTIDKEDILSNFNYTVNPSTCTIKIQANGLDISVSESLPEMKFENFKKTENKTEWFYSKQQMGVKLEKERDCLRLIFSSKEVADLAWPSIKANAFYLPIGEGKYIKSNDSLWFAFLQGQEADMNEFLSMPFVAGDYSSFALLYIFQNRYNNEVGVSDTLPMSISVKHSFTPISKDNDYIVEIYLVKNNPVAIAKKYKEIIVEAKKFKSLASKAQENKNIEKLYGAAHFYLWDREIIDEKDIDFQSFQTKAKKGQCKWFVDYLSKHLDVCSEALNVWPSFVNDSFSDKYQKRVLTDTLNLMMSDFLLTGNNANKKEADIYDLNKEYIKNKMGDSVLEIEKWGNGVSLQMLDLMKNAGIEKAWIGLNEWKPGLQNRNFVKYAESFSYLIGPYDSYNSIHNKKDESWATAWFDDVALYDTATVTNRNGEKHTGFLGKGRHVNPVYILNAVKNRVDSILVNNVAFNSWFIDCDAAGELHEDYTPSHLTSQFNTWKGRQARIAYIRDKKNMVIGSELGIDYAACDIAFAHGLETPVIAWSDPDMRKNEKSEYFIGKYWSISGGVPERFGKQVPLKELYEKIYLSEDYSIPLYKLVYNDSVITSHHWENASLKYKNKVVDRMLYEMLYNVPPLYHLDLNIWLKYESVITKHVKEFSFFHNSAVQKEMTDFNILSEDKKLQMTSYGKDQFIIVNYSDVKKIYKGMEIPAKSAMIVQSGKSHIYTPREK